uniref:Uncharacterized protein n=1 Tax=Anguilla anguilla TaxID=7936 RepID=A0A0E9Q804_ANGAN
MSNIDNIINSKTSQLVYDPEEDIHSNYEGDLSLTLSGEKKNSV